MDIKNLILIIIAALNFFIGLVILLRNYKSKVNWSFSLLLFSVVFWSISLAISREAAISPFAIFWSKSAYYSSAFIAFLLLWFSFAFPYKRKNINIITKLFIWTPSLIILAILLKGNLLIKGLEIRDWGYDVQFGHFWYWIYSIYILFFFIWAYYNIWKSYLISSGFNRLQLKFILIGLLLAGVFGIVFDLLLPYFGNWKLNWLGPYFSILVLFSTSYLIFYKPNKQN